MVTLIVYLELKGIFWVRAGSGAQAKGVYRCYFLKVESGKFAFVFLLVLAKNRFPPR